MNKNYFNLKFKTNNHRIAIWKKFDNKFTKSRIDKNLSKSIVLILDFNFCNNKNLTKSRKKL